MFTFLLDIGELMTFKQPGGGDTSPVLAVDALVAVRVGAVEYVPQLLVVNSTHGKVKCVKISSVCVKKKLMS